MLELRSHGNCITVVVTQSLRVCRAHTTRSYSYWLSGYESVCLCKFSLFSSPSHYFIPFPPFLDMDPIKSILKPILDIALKVYNLCQQVKSNRKRCARLSKRVSLLVELLEAAREQDLCDKTMLVRKALTELGDVMQTAKDLVQAHVDACWIERMWNAEEMGKQFNPLNVKLSQAADTLSLALQVEHR